MRFIRKNRLYEILTGVIMANLCWLGFGCDKYNAPVRQKLDFNGGWLFYRGEIAGDSARLIDFDTHNWQTVHLPHSAKIMPLRQPWRPDFEGITWYRKTFKIPRKYSGSQLFLEFEGADQKAEVWLNGVLIATPQSPYLPFMVDISDQVKFGDANNILTVKVTNFVDNDIPGYGAWYSFGGLYRDVYLHITDRLHISDPVYVGKPADGGVFIRYSRVDSSAAVIEIRTNIVNDYNEVRNCRIVNNLLDAEGHRVASDVTTQKIAANSDRSVDQQIILANPQLWHPDHPYLYTLRSDIYYGGKLTDRVFTRTGIRHIEFDSDGFRINGEKMVFRGTNHVQEYPYVSWALPNAAQRREVRRLKAAGFQYVRSSHNPHDPAFLDACDEIGLLVMDCTPGFQYIGGERFRENSFQNMRDMIRRDRNHPSVILWELSLNETEFDADFARKAVQIGHAEYPGDQCFVAGWKFPEIYDVFIRASQHGARDYSGKTPLVISEYGHWDYNRPDGNSSDVERQKGERAMLNQACNHHESLNLNRALPFLCGDGLWVATDFQYFPSGVMDYFRLPKFSYYFFQSQRNPELIFKDVNSGPMVFIANYWTAESPDTITVFSNCERVDLFLNGRLAGSQVPDRDILTKNLSHPPFTFTNIPWERGEIKAIGYIHEQAVTSHRRLTPGEPTGLSLSSDLADGEIIEGNDLVFIYASVVDANGTTVPAEPRRITFRVKEPGVLLSPDTITTEAGVATALLRIYTKKKTVIGITAESEGLAGAGLSLTCTGDKSRSNY